MRIFLLKQPLKPLLSLAMAIASVIGIALGPGVQKAHADFFVHQLGDFHAPKGTSNFQLGSIYYVTHQNFSPTGTRTALGPSGEVYTRFQNDLSFALGGFTGSGILENLTLFGRAGWIWIYQGGLIRPGTSYGFADQTAGLNYQLLRLPGDIALRLQFQADFPVYNPATSQGLLQPDLGDGTTDLTGSLFVSAPLLSSPNGHLTLNGGAGYTSRSLNYSSAVPWVVSLGYLPTFTGWLAELQGSGVISLKTDVTPVRSSVGSGGSFITGGINPTLILAQAKVGYRLGSGFQLAARASMTPWGQDVPEAYTVGVVLQKTFGDPGSKPNNLTSRVDAYSPESVKDDMEYTKSNRGFLNYSLDAKILRTNDRLHLVKIDKGSQDGVERRQIFDIFAVKKDGSIGAAVARAVVTSVKENESALEVTEYFKEIWIDEGFIAKKLIE